jgi:aldose 1-epimerase
VGRYANRIKNSTFEVDGKTYHTPANENGGLDTLHGGTEGYGVATIALMLSGFI